MSHHMACAAHRHRVAKQSEDAWDLHCWAEVVDEPPTATSIFGMEIGGSSKSSSRLWSSWRMASSEFDCSSMTVEGFLKRSIPISFAQSAKGIDDELDVRSWGIACPVEDMKTMGCSLSLVISSFRED